MKSKKTAYFMVIACVLAFAIPVYGMAAENNDADAMNVGSGSDQAGIAGGSSAIGTFGGEADTPGMATPTPGVQQGGIAGDQFGSSSASGMGSSSDVGIGGEPTGPSAGSQSENRGLPGTSTGR